MVERLAIFPLGSVLLPGGVLPLRLFEPRYLRFIDDVLAADARFGVVLIERGHEVGGGDVRSGIGCVAEIVRAGRLGDGTWQVLATGAGRFEVVEWLPDDPYPAATVRALEDEPTHDADAHLDPRWLTLVDAFRDLERRIGARVERTAAPLELSGDPATLTFEIACALPITAYDKQRVLAARTPDARRELLLDAIETLATLVRGPETN